MAHPGGCLRGVQAWLRGVAFQSAVQLAVGLFLCCLFTYVRPITFPQACVIATLFLVAAVQMCMNNHAGTRLLAAASLLGATWPGVLVAAVVGSLCKLVPTGPAATGMLCVLGPACIALLAINKVATLPPTLWVQGMSCCLAFGMTAITTWRTDSIGQVWLISAFILLDNVIAAVLAAGVAMLVAPTLASHAVQDTMSHVLRSAGTCTSRAAARLFRPAGDAADAGYEPSYHNGHVAAAAAAAVAAAAVPAAGEPAAGEPAAGDAAAVRDAGTYSVWYTDGSVHNNNSSSSSSKAVQHGKLPDLTDGAWHLGPAPVDEWAGADVADVSDGADSVLYGLGEAGAALVMQESMTEERWLRLMQRNSSPKPAPPRGYRCPVPHLPVASLWPPLAQANTLLLAAAAAEPQWLRASAACGGGGGLGAAWFNVPAWRNVGLGLQQLLTRLGALEAVVEDGETLQVDHTEVHALLLARLRLAYSQAATSLALMSDTVAAYGRPSRSCAGSEAFVAASRSSSAVAPEPPADDPAGGGGKRAAPAPVGGFCGLVSVFGRSWAEAKAELATFMQEEVEEHWQRVVSAAPNSPAVLPSLAFARHLFFTWSLTNALIDSIEALEKAVAVAVCGGPPPSPLLAAATGWLAPLAPDLSGRHMFANWRCVLGQQLPATLRRGWRGIRDALGCRLVVAWLKYSAVLALVFVATVVAMKYDAAIRSLNPAFGFIAASLAMSNMVEATVSKASFWLLGSALGGTIGHAAMFHPALSTNAVALTAIIVAAAAGVGVLASTRARTFITLSLMTLTALILCQCCAGGRQAVTLARLVSVLAGITTAVCICNLVAPWYTSDWSLDILAATLRRATGLLLQLNTQHYRDGAAAVAALETTAPTSAAAAVLAADCGVTLGHAQSDKEAAADMAAAVAAATASGMQLLAGGGSSGPQQQAAARPAGKDGGLLPVTAPPLPPPPAAAAAAADSGGGRPADGAGIGPDVTPAMLQQLVALPLVQVQVALVRDAVAWRRGVLATPPVVPQLLQVLLGLLDRLTALQLSLNPASIIGVRTGIYMLHYAVPTRDNVVGLTQLLAQLASATATALLKPCPGNKAAVKELIDRLERLRVGMFRQMQLLRQELHLQVMREQQQLRAQEQQQLRAQEQQQQQQQQQQALCGPREGLLGDSSSPCAVRKRMAMLLGSADDVVAYLGSIFASIKATDRVIAAARVATADCCQARNHKRQLLK